nr:hypothetical protein [Tanacetum cinerariifolium]
MILVVDCVPHPSSQSYCWRLPTWTPEVSDTVVAEFLPDLDEEDTIAIDVEDEHYDVGETRVEDVVRTNRFEYQFKLETQILIVQNQEMKNGMNVVFTKKRNNRIQIMLFNEDGAHKHKGKGLKGVGGRNKYNIVQLDALPDLSPMLTFICSNRTMQTTAIVGAPPPLHQPLPPLHQPLGTLS